MCSSESRRGTVYDASNIGPVQKIKQRINFIMGQKLNGKYIFLNTVYIYITFGIL